MTLRIALRALRGALFVSRARRARIVARAIQAGRFLRLVGQRFAQDRCSRAAGALSFTTLFAVVPFMAVVFATFSIFPVFQRMRQTLKDFLYDNFVPTAGDVVERYVDLFVANAGRLTVWGLLFVLATAVMLMATIEHTFNDIWHVQENRKRLYRMLGYWGILTLGPVLVAAGLSLTAFASALPWFAPAAPAGGVRTVVLGLLPLVLEVAAFMLLYSVVPNRTVRWRHAAIGAAIAAALFEFAKHWFGFYISRYGTYQVIYGAIATLPVFLLWVYLSWLVVLFGAVVTATLPEWRSLRVPLRNP